MTSPMADKVQRLAFNREFRRRGIASQVCNTCHVTKEHAAFARASKSTSGYQYKCQACSNAYSAPHSATRQHADGSGWRAYHNAHMRLYYHLGAADKYTCACGCGEQAKQWALINDHPTVQRGTEYVWSDDRTAYRPLSVLCHAQQDALDRRTGALRRLDETSDL